MIEHYYLWDHKKDTGITSEILYNIFYQNWKHERFHIFIWRFFGIKEFLVSYFSIEKGTKWIYYAESRIINLKWSTNLRNYFKCLIMAIFHLIFDLYRDMWEYFFETSQYRVNRIYLLVNTYLKEIYFWLNYPKSHLIKELKECSNSLIEAKRDSNDSLNDEIQKEEKFKDRWIKKK